MTKRQAVDVLMTIGMFFSMSVFVLGTGSHKMIGLITFLLFIVHNVLNRKWYKTLFKGNYSPMRMVHTINNLVVLLAMTGILVSGVMLSKDVAVGFGDEMTVGRMVHNTSSYVGCVGVAFHIGFHLKGKKQDD